MKEAAKARRKQAVDMQADDAHHAPPPELRAARSAEPSSRRRSKGGLNPFGRLFRSRSDPLRGSHAEKQAAEPLTAAQQREERLKAHAGKVNDTP